MVGHKEDGSNHNAKSGKVVYLPLAVHFGCQYAGFLHDTTVFEGLLIGLPDDEFSRGHSFIEVC